MGKIIAVAMPKGGVGKTTTAVNLAANLAIAEKNVLLIDLDPISSCNVALGISPENIKSGLFELLNCTASIEQVTTNTSIKNLSFISSILSNPLNAVRFSRLSLNTLFFSNIIRSTIYTYDYIILDCPPYFSGFTNCALLTTNSVIIPIKQEMFSLNALSKIIDHIKWIKKNGNFNLKIEGILLTMYENRTKVTNLTEEKLLQKDYSKYLFKTVIPYNTTIAEANYEGVPIMNYRAMSKGAQAYLMLTEEILLRSS